MSGARGRPSLREPLAVWALYAVTATATVVTYARLPAEDLWNVSGSGLEAGLSRAVVHLNFPVSLVAIALVLVAVERLGTAGRGAGTVAIGLCLVTVAPGVVRAEDLDARWVNALPVIGVALALGLSLAALRRGGLGAPARPTRLDGARIALGAVLALVSLPWVAALLGLHLDGPYLSSAIVPEVGRPNLAAVHLGLHHGFDGVTLAASALILSRVVRGLRPSPRRSLLAAYLSTMLVYGIGNVVHDAWLEQLVKRGWVDTRLPELTKPEWNTGWAVVVAVSAALAVVVLYRLGRDRPDAPPAARVPV